MKIVTYLVLFSAISFLFFGIACFTTKQMRSEFERYGLASVRTIVGSLQLLGGLGLLVGWWFKLIQLQITAAAGLTILMLLGFAVRLKIKDSVIQSAPSLLYAILNAYIIYALSTVLY